MRRAGHVLTKRRAGAARKS